MCRDGGDAAACHSNVTERGSARSPQDRRVQTHNPRRPHEGGAIVSVGKQPDSLMGAMLRGGCMAREFEVKLEIPASTVSKVMRLPWLWQLASGELRASRIASTYYDTPRDTLRERGITLRVRRVGANYLQTIKAAVNGAALPIERDEWEEQIVGDEPELKLAAGTPLAGISRKKLRRRLQPCFEVQVDRSAFPIQSANSAIEVAIDRANIVGPAATSFCEIELELKRGASSELARIARRIATEVPAALVLTTKADRGFALRKGEPPTPCCAEPISLTRSVRVGDALQAIGWSCLRHFALNKDAVEQGDARGVHQMRVGIRRLRAAIAVFKHLLDGPETDAVNAELMWLADELRPARDLDVLLEKTLAPMQASHMDPAALAELCEDTASRRSAALDRAKTAVTSDRHRQLVLRTALWLIASEWSDKTELAYEQPSRRIGAFADRWISEQSSYLIGELRRFRRLFAGDIAKLREPLKDLRYATEFFEGALLQNERQRQEFLATLRTLLRHLGRLNDFAVHERLHHEFMASWTGEGAANTHTAPKAFAMGFAMGRLQQEKERRIAAVEKAIRRLSALSVSWLNVAVS